MLRTVSLAVAWCCLLALIAPVCIWAQAEEPKRLLIRNVLLIDREEQTDDRTVNILVKAGKLKLVTPDNIPAKDASIVIDAEGGFLLGKLTIGAATSFLILDQDPREVFEVLLDTDAHARFAFHEGQIIRNLLPTRFGSESEAAEPPETPKRSGWLAYTPPPIALPLSYDNERKWNLLDTKYFSGLFAAATILDRQRWIGQNADSLEQFGDLSEFDGGEIRGFRFGVIGALKFKRPWVYTFFAATNAFDKGFETEKIDDLTLFDYRLDIPLFGKTTLSIGKQKEPISQERMMVGTGLPMQERAAVSDALLPARNVGVVLNGTGAKQRMTWAVGAFNDWFDSGVAFSDSATQVAGRVTWLPFLTADESNLVHLGLGIRRTDAKEGVRYRTEPEFNLAPEFVDTGLLAAEEAVTYDIEASWRKGPFWLSGEYVRSEVDALDLGELRFGGYYLTVAWALTGEMRAYNHQSGLLGGIRVAQSVYQGGWGAWEVTTRWSNLDLTDRSVDGGEMQIFSLGLNWFLTDTFYVNFNYRDITLDRFGIHSRSNGLLSRVILILE